MEILGINSNVRINGSYGAFSNAKTFQDAVMLCFNNKQFLSEYDRLNGTNLSKRLSPIENMIDEVTKMRDIEMLGFIAFVDNFIWTPVVADSRNVQAIQ